MFVLMWLLAWAIAFCFTDRYNVIEYPVWLVLLILAVWLDTD